MKKRIVAISAMIALGSIFAIVTILNSIDHKILEKTFVIEAIYFEKQGFVEINFQDKSNKTKHVTLEILGMPESFHKEYMSTTFVEKIQISSTPKYGWQSIPVTLLVEHEEFGKIGIKTEIRPVGEIPSSVIFSRG